MRLILFITTLFFITGIYAQTDDCKEGTDSAKADFKKGILRTYMFGGTSGKILIDEYGIDAINLGCIVEEKWVCYSNFMDDKIKEKYGNDIFEKVSKKTKQLDSSGGGNREAYFPGGENELYKFVYCNLDLKKANYIDSKIGIVHMRFTIDTEGKVKDINVLKGFSPEYDKEAIRILSLMPKWSPATQNGKIIERIWSLPIKFNKAKKRQYCPEPF